jgi:hypothetical protein
MTPRWFDLNPLTAIDPTPSEFTTDPIDVIHEGVMREGDSSASPQPVVGCVFGGARSDELPEIPLAEAVETLHRIADRLRAI